MTQNDHSEDLLLSRPEVQERFGLSRRYLEISAVRGDGPPMIKLGRVVRYRVGDLRAWIKSHRLVSTRDDGAVERLDRIEDATSSNGSPKNPAPEGDAA